MSLTIKKIPNRRGTLAVLVSVLVGIVLARFMIVSTPAAILLLSGGIVFALTLLLRKIDLLIYGWFFLTTFVFFITANLLPQYFEFLGTFIFWGLLGCIIAAWVVDNTLSGRQFARFGNVPVMATIFVFLLWGIMAVFTSVDVLISIKRFSHIVIGLAASYMFFDFFSRDQRNVKKTLGVLSFLIVSVSCMTVATAGYSLVSGTPIYKQIDLWLMGSNPLGSLLCNSIPIVMAAGLHFTSNKTTRFLLTALMLLALFFTFSRTSWLAMLSALAFFQWKSRSRQSLWLIIIFGLIVVAWLFPVVAGDFYDYITGDRYSGRKYLWEASWNMAADHPILGVGPGNAMYLMGDYLTNTVYAKLVGVEDTHSLYLKNMAEMGFFSAVIWLVLFVIFVYNSIKIENNLESEFLKLVCRGATATFLSLSVHGIAENGFFMTPFVGGEFNAILPYVVFAMPFAAKKLEEGNQKAV